MTNPPPCAWCTRPDPTGGYVCPTCFRPVGEALREMVRLADEPAVNIARQARYGSTNGPRSAEPPIPVDLDASAASWAAAHVVVTWMDHIATTRGVPLPKRDRRPVGPLCAGAAGAVLAGRCGHPSCDAIRHHQREHPVAAAARFVAGQLEWLRHTPDASDAGEELLGAAAAVRRVVENPADRWYAGTCCEPLPDKPGELCTTELYAWPGVTWVRCPGCGTVHQTGPRVRWLLAEARDVRGTATQLATAAARLGRACTAGQLRALAQRGRLLPATVALADGIEGPEEVDRDEWGRARYRFGDVLDVLDQVAEQRRRDELERAQRAAERARKAAEEAAKHQVDVPA
ncbi:hypothetical protein OOK41_01275 [Micromonospora sp. NBC_01655]|uniref:hypothetical protein n=1 Tax=Micromonospora sp. NBC_01655 TaxID=2975983 RepID=UPI002252800F|nr:hypothetical protein [Micromonospora sp. NBC_01655]MCX4468955.1 hypothetical protein [Micromonospora sp. NBC_01655]